jgi:hypothetical protein
MLLQQLSSSKEILLFIPFPAQTWLIATSAALLAAAPCLRYWGSLVVAPSASALHPQLHVNRRHPVLSSHRRPIGPLPGHYLLQKCVVSYVPVDSISLTLHERERPPVSNLPIVPPAAECFEDKVGTLLAGFFRYYACEFDWSAYLVSLSRVGHNYFRCNFEAESTPPVRQSTHIISVHRCN